MIVGSASWCGGILIVLKETGCDGRSIRICEGLAYEPTKIYGLIRVLEFGVLRFKAVLDLTSIAFLGAADARGRVARVAFGEPILPTCGKDVFFKVFGLRVCKSDLIRCHQPMAL